VGIADSPTLLVGEVKSWCYSIAGNTCDNAVLVFIPGNEQYFDRVRYPVEQPYPETTNYVVPTGILVEYLQDGERKSLGADDEYRDIYVHEAMFMRVV